MLWSYVWSFDRLGPTVRLRPEWPHAFKARSSFAYAFFIGSHRIILDSPCHKGFFSLLALRELVWVILNTRKPENPERNIYFDLAPTLHRVLRRIAGLFYFYLFIFRLLAGACYMARRGRVLWFGGVLALHRALRRMAGLVFLLVFWALAGAGQRHGVGAHLLFNSSFSARGIWGAWSSPAFLLLVY